MLLKQTSHGLTMNKRLILLILVISSVFLNTTLASGQTFNYLEKISDTSKEINWEVGDKTLTVSDKNMTYTSTYDENSAVTKWVYKKGDENTSVTAQRKGNRIGISGNFKGERITKSLKLNSAPWYQPLSFSLKPFIASSKSAIIFWTVNPRNLSAYRMKAQKIKKETIRLNNESVPTQKIKVSLAGPKAMFWSSYYWFRLSDGVFLQYQGVDGPPGTPETLTKLTSEKNN